MKRQYCDDLINRSYKSHKVNIFSLPHTNYVNPNLGYVYRSPFNPYYYNNNINGINSFVLGNNINNFSNNCIVIGVGDYKPINSLGHNTVLVYGKSGVFINNVLYNTYTCKVSEKTSYRLLTFDNNINSIKLSLSGYSIDEEGNIINIYYDIIVNRHDEKFVSKVFGSNDILDLVFDSESKNVILKLNPDSETMEYNIETKTIINYR